MDLPLEICTKHKLRPIIRSLFSGVSTDCNGRLFTFWKRSWFRNSNTNSFCRNYGGKRIRSNHNHLLLRLTIQKHPRMDRMTKPVERAWHHCVLLENCCITHYKCWTGVLPYSVHLKILHTNQNHHAMLLIKTAMATAVAVLPQINLTITTVATKTNEQMLSDLCSDWPTTLNWRKTWKTPWRTCRNG